MASIPFRINGINIEKVYGASRRRLIFNQLKKNIILCAASFVLATGMMEVIAGSEFASFSCCSLHVGDNVPSITICFIVALATAAVGGLMTALYTSIGSNCSIRAFMHIPDLRPYYQSSDELHDAEGQRIHSGECRPWECELVVPLVRVLRRIHEESSDC